MAEYIDRTALGIGYADPKTFIIPAHAEGWNTAVQIINEAPTADVAPVVHGRWECVDTDIDQFFLCNRCKNKEYWESNYCPHCGAKMDEEEHNSMT